MAGLVFVVLGLFVIAATCETSGGVLDEQSERTQITPHNWKSDSRVATKRTIDYGTRKYVDGTDTNQVKHYSQGHRRDGDWGKRKKRGRVYAPIEDPRKFYQSEKYLKDSFERNDLLTRRQMGSIFPKLENRPARLNAYNTPQTRALNMYDKKDWNSVLDYDDDLCIKCPSNRTLVTASGSEQVTLTPFYIKTCSGDKLPRGVRFVRSHGPTFGDSLKAGSYEIEGRFVYKRQTIETCRYYVHVATRLCKSPPSLTAACDGIRCNFTCADRSLHLVGSPTLICGDDLRWSGKLPFCRGDFWCPLPEPPDYGQLSCHNKPRNARLLVDEGSRCRLRCAAGWRPAYRTTAVCRRGRWSSILTCKRIKPIKYTGRNISP